ncbi:MAG: AzlD domain-containing protein [Clostridia bacterium]|nr:AzlD domain-containing protein [Clostridia bacterium]
MNNSFWIYLLVMVLTTYLIRALPFSLFRKKIKSKRLQAFFDYIPYAVLTSMTVPAIFYSGINLWAGILGFAVAMFLSYKNKSLLFVAIGTVIAAFVGGFIPF